MSSVVPYENYAYRALCTRTARQGTKTKGGGGAQLPHCPHVLPRKIAPPTAPVHSERLAEPHSLDAHSLTAAA